MSRVGLYQNGFFLYLWKSVRRSSLFFLLNGFEKRGETSPTTIGKSIKKFVIILYWSPENADAKKTVDRIRIKHPTVKVKIISETKGANLKAHNIHEYPTVLLLKNGREIDRITGENASRESVLSQLFRRAYS